VPCLEKVVRFEEEMLGQPRKSISATNSTDSSGWAKAANPPCSISCDFSQICLFDGHCRCPATDGLCNKFDENNIKAVFKLNPRDPIELAQSLSTTSILLERSIIPWSLSSNEKYLAGKSANIKLYGCDSIVSANSTLEATLKSF